MTVICWARSQICILLCAFLLTAPVSAENTLRIASYNVDNLWDHDSENTPCVWDAFLKQQPAFTRSIVAKKARNPQYRTFARKSCNYYKDSIYQAKVQSFLRSIELMNFPDVLAIQEIESAGGDTRVFEMPVGDGRILRQALNDMGYQWILVGEQSELQPVAVTTAVISKIPFVVNDSVEIDFGEPSTSARNIQVVETDPDGPYGHLVILNGHWMSRMGPNKGEDERRHTVRVLRDYVNEMILAAPKAQIILLGDFNTEPNDPVFHSLGVTGNAKDLAASGFYSLWAEKPKEQRWDLSYAGSHYALSHMLLGSNFFKKSSLTYKPSSFNVVGQQPGDSAFRDFIDFQGLPRQWQVHRIGSFSYQHLGFGHSDHLPLVATFVVNGKRAPRPSLSSYGKDESFYSDLPLRLPDVAPCKDDEVFDAQALDFANPRLLEGLCVRIEPENPAVIWTAPGGHSAITLPHKYQSSPLEQGTSIVLGMSRADDFRPNVDDARVTFLDVEAAESQGYSPLRTHPQSNRCYVRRVLNGGGGRLKKIIGRLGFSDGVFRVHARTRQDIEIIDLPLHLQQACNWLNR